ncbi:hypothetical protein GOC19_25650 [Sinorhizobium meliloti]|nr:hypothetical protein [Sinorhizobium meliloti]MDX0615187.1 hypothetical protein [Sinorhizobium medicae]
MLLESTHLRGTKSEMHGFHVHNSCSMFRFVLILGAHTGDGHHPSLVAFVFNSPFENEWRAKLGIYIRPRATPQTLTAIIRGSASEIPLKVFQAKEVDGGVTAKIWGSVIQHPGAFIFGGPIHDHNRALGMGGHVFHRVGKTWAGKGKRGPIERSAGGKISEAMAKDAVSTANETYAVERLQVNVLRQLDRATRRRGG